MNEIMRLGQVVVELFGSLDNADQIAQMCRERQIQGFLNSSNSCPMTKMVRENVKFPIAFTTGKKLGTGQFHAVLCDRSIAIPAPIVCDEFADNFDSGKYPDLVAFGNKETS